MAQRSLYDVLDISPQASPSEITGAYRQQVRLIHPDRGGSPALFRDVQEAYEVLSDPARRQDYDRTFRNQENKTEDRPRPSEEAAPASSDTWSKVWAAALHHPTLSVFLGGFILLTLGTLGREPLAAFVGIVACGFAAIAGLGKLGGVGHTNPYRTSQLGDLSIDTMSGTEFELLLTELFRRAGYSTQHVGGTGDFGGDLLLAHGRDRTIVQAKRSSTPVGPPAIQQVVGAKAPYNAASAMVITNNAFTKHATALAEANRVLLWDRATLLRELKRHSLIAEPQYERGGEVRLLALQFVSGVLLLFTVMEGGKRYKRRRR